jgi:SAM-dependent methyltransferase
MSSRESIAVRLILLLNKLTPDLSAETTHSKRALNTYSQFEYGRATSAVHPFGRYFAAAGKDVLDLGCGLGGGERYCLEQGARSVTAIDLSVPRLNAGRTYICDTVADGAQRCVLFAAVDARRMAFPDAAFDLIVSTNTFEHIFGVEKALQECARVLKPGGHLLISFPPYGSPWGAHLNNWIRFPWSQVLFSERVLVAAVRRIEANLQVNVWMPEAIRLDLDGCDEIPHLNRMSVREFEALAMRAPLTVVHTSYQAIGWRSGGLLGTVGRLLARSKWLREYVTSQAVYVLEKAAL